MCIGEHKKDLGFGNNIVREIKFQNAGQILTASCRDNQNGKTKVPGGTLSTRESQSF